MFAERIPLRKITRKLAANAAAKRTTDQAQRARSRRSRAFRLLLALLFVAGIGWNAAATERRVLTVSSTGVKVALNASFEAERPTLEIVDVEEFSAETNAVGAERVALDGFAAIDAPTTTSQTVDGSAAATDSDDAATLESVANECFFALDPFSSLLIEYEPTAEWTNAALERVDDVLLSLPTNPTRAAATIRTFRAEIAKAESLKAAIVADARAEDRRPRSKNKFANVAGDASKSSAEILNYSLEQRLELFEAFRSALDRRAFVWLRAANYFAAKNAGLLVKPAEISKSELLLLQKRTEAARAFFGNEPIGLNWRTSFEVDSLAEDVDRLLKASTTFVPTTSAKNWTNGESAVDATRPLSSADARRALLEKYLRDRLNSVCYKLEKTPMTPDQRRVFQRDPLDKWVAAVEPRSCDQADGLELLLNFERYERSGGGEAGQALQQNARRMTTSRSEVCQKFGRAFEIVYDNPNVKAYISEALINRLLPIRDPEFDVVQETVLNNPVAGRRRTDAQVSIALTPDPTRLLMNLNVEGRIVAQTRSTVFPATLHNESLATYFGRKTLEWQDFGIAYSPTTVATDSVNKLSAVQTDVDFVPLVGDLAREVVRSQYESKRGAIREETKARVAREVRERIDGEANERFDAVNRRLRENFFADLARLSLSLKTQRSKTTDEWLLASLRFGTDCSLGGQTTEPPTLPGAFADFKIHESAINAALARLELAGRTGTPRETLDYVAEKLDKPTLKDVEIEENELVFSFADVDPIVLRFFEDRVRLRLRFARLTLGESSWNDVEVVASYRPQGSPDGKTTFVRDGVVELDGPLNIRAQIPLRAIFSKIFPAEKSFDLQPKIFETDERFAGLALGLCRVSRGWFAISVVCP